MRGWEIWSLWTLGREIEYWSRKTGDEAFENLAEATKAKIHALSRGQLSVLMIWGGAEMDGDIAKVLPILAPESILASVSGHCVISAGSPDEFASILAWCEANVQWEGTEQSGA